MGDHLELHMVFQMRSHQGLAWEGSYADHYTTDISFTKARGITKDFGALA